MECEAAVVGEQGGERNQVGPIAVSVLLQHVAGGWEAEGGAAAGRVSSGVASVGASRAAPGAAGVQQVGFAQSE